MGPWGILLWLVVELTKHHIFSWADEKLKEHIGPTMSVLLGPIRDGAAWAVNHPVELAIGCGVLYCVGGVYYIARQRPAARLAELPGTQGKAGVISPATQSVKIHTIDFEYMKDPQDSPLNCGWKWADKGEKVTVGFGVPQDAPVAGSLAIVPNGGYGMDFVLQQSLHEIDLIEALPITEMENSSSRRLKNFVEQQLRRWLSKNR